MKELKVLLLVSFVALSCNNDDGSSTMEFFEFRENSNFLVEEQLNGSNRDIIENGQNTVFIFDTTNDIDSLDGEFSQRLIFEINAELDSFEFVDEELSQIEAYYFMTNSEFNFSVPIRVGSISGNRLSILEWQISIDIIIERENSNEEIVIEEIFSNLRLLASI